MEIKIEKQASENFYSEVLDIISNYKKLLQNPRRKIKGLIKQSILLNSISFLFLIAFTLLYILNNSYTMYLYVIVLFVITSILGIFYFFLIKRRISQLKHVDADKKFIINDEFVELDVGEEKTRLLTSEIQYVILNKYSICFIPKNNNFKLIAIPIEYKELILKSIKNQNIIFDNSDLY